MPQSHTSSVSNSQKSNAARLNISVGEITEAPVVQPRVYKLDANSSFGGAERADLLVSALESLVDPELLDADNISENGQGYNAMGKLNSVARNINDKRSFKRETSVTELFKHPEMPKNSLKASISSNNGFSPINTCGKIDSFTRKIEMDQSHKLGSLRVKPTRASEGEINYTFNVIN